MTKLTVGLGHWSSASGTAQDDAHFTLEVDEAKLGVLVARARQSRTGKTTLAGGALVVKLVPTAADTAGGPFTVHHQDYNGKLLSATFALLPAARYLAQKYVGWTARKPGVTYREPWVETKLQHKTACKAS